MTKKLQQVAVLGCGVMGRGIAALLMELAGQVWLFDARPEVATQAAQELQAQFQDTAAAKLRVAAQLSELAACDLVIEAIAEDLTLKQQLLRELEKWVDDDCLLASNTSSLSITAIASACSQAQRVLGLHFFNPVQRMRLIELIPAVQTETSYLTRVQHWFATCQHTVLLAADSPGFIVNHAGRGYGLEALRIWQEDVAEPGQIDSVMRAQGFKLGPFELIDLVGLDVSLPVMQAIYQQYYYEPRYQPSVLLQKRLQAGWLGRKSGRGFYRYDELGKKIKPTPEPGGETPVQNWQQAIWFDASDVEAQRYLPPLLLRAGIATHCIETSPRPSAQALILLTPQGEDCSSMVARLNLPAERCLALDSWLSAEKTLVLMPNPATAAPLLQAFANYLKVQDFDVQIVQDSAGLVFQRIIANIINIAAEMAQQAIASPDAIDQAVQLGLAYPQGPLAWGDQLGLARVYRVLCNLHACTGEARYRPSLWLQRRAQLHLSLLHSGSRII